MTAPLLHTPFAILKSYRKSLPRHVWNSSQVRCGKTLDGEASRYGDSGWVYGPHAEAPTE
jgi:hypothetical protein